MSPLAFRPLFYCTILLALPASAGGSIVFFDGQFDNTNWSIPAFYASGNAYAYNGGHLDSGGSPGSMRRISHINNFMLMTHHLRNVFSYSASQNGEIDSIDFELDTKALDNAGMTVSLMIRQDSIFYYTPVYAFPSSPSWTHREALLHESDFGRIEDFSMHPDFSESGAAMDFGMSVFRDNSVNFQSRTVGVDNWKVTINNVPEPHAGLVLLCLMFGVRRKKSDCANASPA